MLFTMIISKIEILILKALFILINNLFLLNNQKLFFSFSLGNTHLSTQSQNTPSQHKNIRMNSFTFIAFAIGMVCALAQDGTGTPVTCSEVLTSSDCTEVSPGSSLYTNVECGMGEDIDGCNTENCCGESTTCVPDFIADGDCDESNNNADCGFDGGDCCDCICDESTCEASGSDCRDPNACGVDDFTDDYGLGGADDAGDTCVPDFIGDGDCDESNNNADCGNYDGGDCCDCICDESNCEVSGSDYRDPNACGSNAGDDDELPMGPCDTPCLENCDLDWICTS